MKASTVAALDRINRRFYDEQAPDFDQTRQGPWRGWKRVVDAVRLHLPEKRPLFVLDVGCGNGRFGGFLADELPTVEIRYTGLDASEALLKRLRGASAPSNVVARATRVWNLLGAGGEGPPALPRPADIWPNDPNADGSSPGFDVTVAFGVFHHVPGPVQPDLFARMVEVTRPGGLVVASFWQFAEHRHFASRRVNWSDAEAAGWIDHDHLADLDDDDWLLQWGQRDALRARYCRATDEAEARATVQPSCRERSRVQWFRADGRTGDLNLYAVAAV